MIEIKKNTTARPLANTLKTASERTGFSVGYLRNCINTGVLPAKRFGRAIRILEKDLIEFLERGVK